MMFLVLAKLARICERGQDEGCSLTTRAAKAFKPIAIVLPRVVREVKTRAVALGRNAREVKTRAIVLLKVAREALSSNVW